MGIGLLEIAVVIAGAGVGRSAWQIAHRDDVENGSWTDHETRVANLSELALQLDQLPNEAIASSHAGEQRQRVQVLAEEMEGQISTLRQQIDDSGAYPALQDELQDVEGAIPSLSSSALAVIDDVGSGRPRDSEKISRLDRAFGGLQKEIGDVTHRLLEEEDALHGRQERASAGMRLWSELLAAAAVVIVIAAALFGVELTSELNQAGRRARADLGRIGAAERRFREMIEGAPDAIVVHHDGTILMVNRRMLELTGFDSPQQLIGTDVTKTVHPDSRAMVQERIAAMKHTGRSPEGPLELGLLRGDGTRVDAEVNTVVVDLDGRPAALALIRDLTQRRQTEQALRSAKEEAEAASRAKSDFLANMSHELRTPLNSVIGFGKVLQEGSYGLVGEKQQRFVGNIVRSGEHMLSLVNDLLDLRKLETGSMTFELESLDVAELIEEASALVRSPLAERRHRLTIGIGTASNGFADRRAVVQVLVNLLTNAAKYTPEGGHVSVGVAECADGIRFEVTDDGRGISPEDVPRLFGVFSRVGDKDARRIAGTGLGLALCKGIVEKLGGTVGVRSEPGKGSTFSFTIPAAKAAAEAHP
jgi:PAS domain S-box-containing protein